MRFLVCVTVMIQNPADGSCADRAHGSGSARRRERRLRSCLRHERMTVRMELAAALHHSSFRGAGPEKYDAPRSQRTANSREYAVFFELYDEDTEEARPDRLVDVRPQGRGPAAHCGADRRLCAGPLLHVPVPQPVDSVVDVLKIIDRGPPELVVDVPMVSLQDVIPLRAALREPQLAEQLVDVPTTPGYAFAVVAVRTLGWPAARALFEQLAASPGRDTNTGHRFGVLVIMQLKFQQSFVENMEVPQTQCFDRVLVQLLHRDRAHSANCAED